MLQQLLTPLRRKPEGFSGRRGFFAKRTGGVTHQPERAGQAFVQLRQRGVLREGGAQYSLLLGGKFPEQQRGEARFHRVAG